LRFFFLFFLFFLDFFSSGGLVIAQKVCPSINDKGILSAVFGKLAAGVVVN